MISFLVFWAAIFALFSLAGIRDYSEAVVYAGFSAFLAALMAVACEAQDDFAEAQRTRRAAIEAARAEEEQQRSRRRQEKTEQLHRRLQEIADAAVDAALAQRGVVHSRNCEPAQLPCTE